MFMKITLIKLSVSQAKNNIHENRRDLLGKRKELSRV